MNEKHVWGGNTFSSQTDRGERKAEQSGGFGFGAAMSRFGGGSSHISKSMEDVFDLPKENTYGKGFSSPSPNMGKTFTVQKQEGLSY